MVTPSDPRVGEIQARLDKANRHSYPAILIPTADVAYLLAELRKAQDALGRVEVECASSPDHILAQRIRAAVAAATGGERG